MKFILKVICIVGWLDCILLPSDQFQELNFVKNIKNTPKNKMLKILEKLDK